MAEKLTAAVAWDELESTAIGTDRFCELAGSEPHEVSQWFAWLRDRIAAEVRDEINPQLAKARRERDEAQAELGRMRATLDDCEEELSGALEVNEKMTELRDDAIRERDAARLELNRLRMLSGNTAPKPRRTGGQKVWVAYHTEFDTRANEQDCAWRSYPDEHPRYESIAKRLGIPDDPEPPSDGELLLRAYDTVGAGDGFWGATAAEFLRLRAERDGGAT